MRHALPIAALLLASIGSAWAQSSLSGAGSVPPPRPAAPAAAPAPAATPAAPARPAAQARP
ncbi:hypothetical protein ACI6QG_14285, partial [Roseococcus sp. DSY-14]|uniref:hypothetical protein n=1 Tax=Roseococcus sp. DSY-14 TaxID=3369650 RepID=UPI00387B78ED